MAQHVDDKYRAYLTFKSQPKNSLKSQPTSSVICHAEFHVEFSIMMLGVVVQNYLHVNLKREPMTLSTNDKSRILKSHDLISFRITYALSVEVVASSTFSLDHGLEAL